MTFPHAWTFAILAVYNASYVYMSVRASRHRPIDFVFHTLFIAMTLISVLLFVFSAARVGP